MTDRGWVIARRVVWGAVSACALLLVGAVALAFVGASKCPTRVDRAKVDLDNLVLALDLYRSWHGHYPEAAEGLGALVADGIIRKMPRDPWDNDYRYTREGEKAVITSFGRDGKPGGEDPDADLSRTASPAR